MSLIPEMFDRLHFTESLYGTPIVSGRSMTIPVQNVLPIIGHPLADRGPISGSLIFDGVVSAERRVAEYIGDSRNPDGFREAYFLHDIENLPSTSDEIREYVFEGVQEIPEAWVDWIVHAQSFALITHEDDA